MDLTDQQFVVGQEGDNQVFYIATQDPGATAAGEKHTGMCKWSREDGWQEVGIVSYETVTLMPGIDDIVLTLVSPVGLITDLKVDDLERSLIKTPDGEVSKWVYRCAERICGNAYAATIKRQIFMREAGSETYNLISSQAMIDHEGAGAIMGIAGFSPDEIYAAATEGELWQYDGSHWHQRASGTDITLTSLASGPDFCVAVGLAGTIVAGRGEEWRVVECPFSNDDFWSVVYFDGAFYMSTTSEVFRLKDGKVEHLPFGEEDVRTTYSLSAGPSGVWSVGAMDIALFDGEKWELIGQS